MFIGTRDGECYGFYLEKDVLKDDYIEISMDEYRTLLRGQAKGKRIVFHNKDGQHPTLEDPPEPTAAQKAEREISQLKAYLNETDYIAAKLAEGAATEEEYSEILKKRREARVRINELEAIIAEAEN